MEHEDETGMSDEDRGDKCLVHGCTNHRGEGYFEGDLCAPCYKRLSDGIMSDGMMHITGTTFIDDAYRVILKRDSELSTLKAHMTEVSNLLVSLRKQHKALRERSASLYEQREALQEENDDLAAELSYRDEAMNGSLDSDMSMEQIYAAGFKEGCRHARPLQPYQLDEEPEGDS
jgi:hypothetical protein